MPMDIEKMRKEGKNSSTILSLLSNSTHNSLVEVVENPFSTGTIDGVY